VEGTGPEIEIAYKLARDSWGRGYATEAAHAVVDHAFDVLGIFQIVAFAFPANTGSRRVLEKVGMVAEPDEERYGHRLARYRLTAASWAERRAQSTT
jgi:RimJ/RimL family protein N-acetyltransferase